MDERFEPTDGAAGSLVFLEVDGGYTKATPLPPHAASAARAAHPPRLVACTVESREGGRQMVFLCATVTTDELEFAERLFETWGEQVAAAAVFHHDGDFGRAFGDLILSDEVRSLLALARRDPAHVLVQGMDLVLGMSFPI